MDALLDALDGLEDGPYGRAYFESYWDVNAFYLTEDHLVLLFPVYADGAATATPPPWSASWIASGGCSAAAFPGDPVRPGAAPQPSALIRRTAAFHPEAR